MSFERNNGGLYDPNAGRYRGSDPEAARAFRELQRVMQQIRSDPIIVITGQEPQPGHYNCVIMDGQTDANRSNTASVAWGIARSGSRFLAVNVLETDGHWVSNYQVVPHAHRRLNTDGTDTFFFAMSWADVNGTNVTVAGGGTNGVKLGGGGTNIVTTGPGDGGNPDPPNACPVDGTACPMTFSIVVNNYGGTGTNGSAWHYKLTRVGSYASWNVANFADQDSDAPSGTHAPSLSCGGQQSGPYGDGIWIIAASGLSGFQYRFESNNGSGCPSTSGWTRVIGPDTCTLTF
jgi:hypothetical protein